MIKIMIALFFSVSFCGFNQEMEDDLFQTWTTNTLYSFMSSEQKKMTVTTNRWVNGESFTELATTYKRSKFNSNKINFSTNYTAHYILEDRKKSNGKFILYTDGKVHSYERTDINNKNIMIGTFYHNYRYKNNVLEFDRMRFKEFVNSGAVEMDSIVTHDSLNYVISVSSDTVYQTDLLSVNTKAYYIVKQNLLVEQNNLISNYIENLRFVYAENSKLEMIVYELKSNSGDKAKNVLKLFYNDQGLLSRTEFYDNTNALIEEKLFTYK